MDARTQAKMEARAAILKALAHPTRLFMVDELSRGERCVADLAELAGADMSSVSKHLSLLKAVGLVQDERRGVQIFYSLAAPCVVNFFGCLESVLQSRIQSHLELLTQ